MTANVEQVASTLLTLQRRLVHQGLWAITPISIEALQSTQPFCVDTMNFNQWLQFIFIPKMTTLIEHGQPLPQLIKGQGIEPMAREFYKADGEGSSLLMLIRQLDELLQEKGN